MTVRKGRLIAVEGHCGPAVAAAARSLARELRGTTGCGVSAWDASGIFTELAAAEAGIAGPSARTLTLLYAADLAFRLRWHIAPALEAGESVVAAPYIESAKALSVAAGLPRRWLDELFAFAPKPHICYRVNARQLRERSGQRIGYSEWFTSALVANGDALDPVTLRARSTEYLNSLEAKRRCTLLTPGEVARLKKPQTRRR
jgi:thymidylate kinase